jgi:murein L,D-transpeptidase YafK
MKKRTAGLIVFFVTAFVGVLALAVASAFRRKRTPLPEGTVADYILIEKRARRLTLFAQHRRLRSYKVALGRGGLRPKFRRGDARTPEGLYSIVRHLEKSRYVHALLLDYPSEKDKAMARRRGDRAGGEITIHGLPRGLSWIGPLHRFVDWTGGSVALVDDEMAELYRVVADGTAVEIRA